MIAEPEPRQAVVVAIVNAMLDAMAAPVAAMEATGAEVFSAMMSCASHGVNCAKENGLDMAPFRDAIGRIYANCGEIPLSERN